MNEYYKITYQVSSLYGYVEEATRQWMSINHNLGINKKIKISFNFLLDYHKIKHVIDNLIFMM